MTVLIDDNGYSLIEIGGGPVCSGVTASHDGIDVRQYVDPPTRTRLWMCAGCAGIATAVGAAFIPDRRSDASRRDRGPVAGSLLTRLRGLVA